MRCIKALICWFFLSIFTFQGCSGDQAHETDDKPQLIIYCGTTMVNVVREIADIFENQYNYTITIEQGGSKDLYHALKKSKKGDLYLPGSESYRTFNLDDGLLGEYIMVGYNQLALIVARGNPEHITPDIFNLTKKKYNIAIGHPEIGSVGRHSMKILTRIGIYDKVIWNAMSVPPDSRLLTRLLKEGTVQLTLNWRATAYFDENIQSVEAIPLDTSIVPKKKLLLNMLNFTDKKEAARKFMILAGSKKGRKIFSKYQFIDKSVEQQMIQQ